MTRGGGVMKVSRDFVFAIKNSDFNAFDTKESCLRARIGFKIHFFFKFHSTVSEKSRVTYYLNEYFFKSSMRTRRGSNASKIIELVQD